MGRGATPASAPPVPAQERTGHALASSAIAANGAALKAQLEGMELTRDQVQAVLALSRDVIERVVWEVVPVLAETLIKEEIQRLTRE